MNDTSETSKSTKSLNDMTLQEIMEYRRVHDRAVILAAAMKGAHVELKTLGEKKNILLIQSTYEEIKGQAIQPFKVVDHVILVYGFGWLMISYVVELWWEFLVKKIEEVFGNVVVVIF